MIERIYFKYVWKLPNVYKFEVNISGLVMIITRRSRVAGAPLVMRKRGEETDALVLREVELRPGSTVRNIAERFDWTNGRVDGSVNRLVSKGKVEVRHALRKGTLVKKVYPKGYLSKPRDIVEIPRNMIDDDLWNETVEVYALSRATIGISPRKVEEWDKRSFRREHVSIRKSDKALEIRLPSSIADFYQLDNSEISLSTIGNLALVTVESTLLPVALPPTYPAEAIYRFTRILMVERFEAIASYSPLSKIDVDFVEGKGEAKQIPIPLEFYRYEVPKKTERIRTYTGSSESVEIPVVVK